MDSREGQRVPQVTLKTRVGSDWVEGDTDSYYAKATGQARDFGKMVEERVEGTVSCAALQRTGPDFQSQRHR